MIYQCNEVTVATGPEPYQRAQRMFSIRSISTYSISYSSFV